MRGQGARIRDVTYRVAVAIVLGLLLELVLERK